MWTRDQKIALFSGITAVIAIVSSIYQKEIRIGLRADPPPSPTIPSSPVPGVSPQPHIISTPTPNTHAETSPQSKQVPPPTPTPLFTVSPVECFPSQLSFESSEKDPSNVPFGNVVLLRASVYGGQNYGPINWNWSIYNPYDDSARKYEFLPKENEFSSGVKIDTSIMPRSYEGQMTLKVGWTDVIVSAQVGKCLAMREYRFWVR